MSRQPELDAVAVLDHIEFCELEQYRTPGYFELLAIGYHKPAKIVRWCRMLDGRTARAKQRAAV